MSTNNYLYIIFFFTLNFCFSQIAIDSSKIRKKVEFSKQIVLTNAGVEKIIDTTILVNDSNKFEFINTFDNLSNYDIVNNYRDAVFSIKNSTIRQFIEPIQIYIDDRIPKEIRKEFKVFVDAIPNIENLSITFVNKLNESNYYINLAEKDFIGISPDILKNYTNEERENLVFEKIKQTCLYDMNTNIYGCRLDVNTSILNDKNVLTKLKKAFFISLGNFTVITSGMPKGSVLDFRTHSIDRLSEDDILLLKMHYFHIYDFKVDSKTFTNFVRLNKKNNEK